MIPKLLTVVIGILLGFTATVVVTEPTPVTEPTLGALTTFTSAQLATGASNGECLTTDGSLNVWSASCGGAFDYPFPSNATTTQITFSGGIVGNLTGNADTATALAADPSDCSAGSFTLGINATGAAQGCTDAWTEAENTAAAYAAQATTITVAGTANQITSSAGAQSLAANRTWTLSIPTDFRVSSTTITGSTLLTNATTTSLGVLDLTAASCDVKSTTSGSLYCGTDSEGSATFSYTPGTFNGQNVNATSTGINFTGSPLSIIASSSLTTNATTTNATSTSLNVSGQVDFDAYTSALLVTGAGGILAEYAGAAACTNQFVTALSALGATTCASINNAQWSGTDLSVANGGTGISTFGGSNTLLYTTAADTLSSEAALTYNASTDLLTTLYATTTALTASAALYGPSLAACPTGATSGFSSSCLDTSYNQIQISTSTVANGYPIVKQPYEVLAFTYGTSSQGQGTTTRYLGPAPRPRVFDKILCEFNQAMGISLYDGTNRANYVIASSTIGTTTLKTNNSFNWGESMRVDIGTSTASLGAVSGGCQLLYVNTAL